MTVQEVVTQATVQQPSHSHTVVTLWVLVGVVLVETAFLWITIKARGGWSYIATIPFVNLRQLVSLVLAILTVVGSGIVGYLSGVWPPEYLVDSVLLALSVWMSIDVAQYWIKRKTTDASIPSTQNMMAAQAAAGVDVHARSAREIAAPGQRQNIPGQTTEMAVEPTATTRPDLGVPDKGVL